MSNISDYFTTKTAIIQQVNSLEESLPIRNDACRAKIFLHPHPTSKVCLFFHGFTAGPYQYEPIGKKLFDAGYNVLVPLQTGHGVAGNWNGDNPPPLPTEREIYQEFALSWLKIAQSLGQQVIVGGLSTGGNLAAWLALEHPQSIEKALLFAPYISGNNAIVNFIVEVLPIYYEWLNKEHPANFGYEGFRIPALRIFLDMGQEIIDRVKNNLAVPIFTIYSESDQAINHSELQDFSKATIEQQAKSWYHSFDKIFEIPHTMMTKTEGNQYQDLLSTVAQAYIESDITWTEVMELGYQILQGNTFDIAAQELNLTERVSPDLSIMLAVMDKKIIIDFFKEKNSACC